MSYSSEVLADSPLLYLRLDEASGTAFTDSSGNSHDGTGTSTTSGSSAIVTDSTHAVTFNGSSSKISVVGFDFSSGHDWSYEGWINLTGSGNSGYKTLFKQGGGGGGRTYLLIDPSDHLYRWGGADSGFVITRSTVHHIVYTWSETTFDEKFYVDGTLVHTSNSGGLVFGGSGSGTVVFGEANGDGHFFEGVMDEVALYDAVLSPTRIGVHYAAGTAAGDTPISGTDTPSVAISESSSVDTGGGGGTAVHLSYHFPTDAEGWGGDSGGAWDSGGLDTGSLLSSFAGSGTEEWTAPGGTWEDFGVPSGATVDSVQLVTASYRVTSTSPSTDQYGTPSIFFDASITYDDVLASDIVGPPITSDTGWVTVGPGDLKDIDPADQASDTAVALYTDIFLDGSGTYALDAIEIDINYTPPPTGAVHLSYHFPTDTQGWEDDPASDSDSAAWDSDGLDTGSLLSSFTSTTGGKGAVWRLRLSGSGSTWEDLGVPAGATVDSVQFQSLSYRVTASSTTGADYLEARASFETLTGEDYSFPEEPADISPITSDSGWVTIGPSAVIPTDPANAASDSLVYGRLAALVTHGGTMTYAFDAIEIDINYTPAEAGTPISASDTLTVGITEGTPRTDTGELPATRIASAYIG